MINTIVALYRAIIIILFVAVLMFAAFAATSGGAYGLMIAIFAVIGSVFFIGVSALLLSINDHLAAMRPGVLGDPSPSPSNVKSVHVFAVVAVLVALLMIPPLIGVIGTADQLEPVSDRRGVLDEASIDPTPVETHVCPDGETVVKVGYRCVQDENGRWGAEL